MPSIKYRGIGYKSSSSLYNHESNVEYMGKDTVVYLSIFILLIGYSPILFLYKPVIAVIFSNMLEEKIKLFYSILFYMYSMAKKLS